MLHPICWRAAPAARPAAPPLPPDDRPDSGDGVAAPTRGGQALLASSFLQQALQRTGEGFRDVDGQKLVALGGAADLVEVLVDAQPEPVEVHVVRSVAQRLEQRARLGWDRRHRQRNIPETSDGFND